MSCASTVAHLQHKLELVEASRRRYQKAATGPRSGDAGVQLTAEELRAAEDALAQLQVEHQEALQRTEEDLRSLRDRCAVLEAEQQAEGQQDSISAHAKIESLTRALEDSEKSAVSANIQLMELKGKYHQTLQDKVKLQRQLRTLQDKLHEIHLQQVETLSSVITNTTRADQMNRRVWESLDKALTAKQATVKSPPAEIASLTAENTLLRKALFSSMQQEDALHTQISHSSARMQQQGSSGRLDYSLEAGPNDLWTSRSESPTQATSPVHDKQAAGSYVEKHAAKQAEASVAPLYTQRAAAMEPQTPPNATPTNFQEAAPPLEDDGSPVTEVAPAQNVTPSVPFSKDVMFDTLKSVLASNGVHMRPRAHFAQDHSKKSSSSTSSGSESSESESSSWSGDDLIATHAAGRSRRSSTASQVQSLSGMLRTPSEGDGAFEQESKDNNVLEGSVSSAKDEYLEEIGFSRSSIREVKRRDSIELSKKRLSPGFKAPAIAVGACSYLKKLALGAVAKKAQAEKSGDPVVTFKEPGDESMPDAAQNLQKPIEKKPAFGAKKLMPGRLWVALKDKGSGDAASGVAAALDGFEDQGDNTEVPGNSDPRPVDPPTDSPAHPHSGAAPQQLARLLQSIPLPSPPANKAGLSLSGHVSPVQSLSSTGSGLHGSRAPSPSRARSPSPAGLPYDSFSERVQLPRNAAHTAESLFRFQDSRNAALEEQAAHIPSYPTTAPQTTVPVRTMWDQSVWEGPMDYPGGQYAHYALLHTPLLAASQERAIPSSMVMPGAGALPSTEDRWSPRSTVGAHGCSSRAKLAGLQYANALMGSCPGYRAPRQVPQVVQLPSAGYALHS